MGAQHKAWPEPWPLRPDHGREGQSRDHDAHERHWEKREKDQGCRSEGFGAGKFRRGPRHAARPKGQGSRPHAREPRAKALRAPARSTSVTFQVVDTEPGNLQNGNSRRRTAWVPLDLPAACPPPASSSAILLPHLTMLSGPSFLSHRLPQLLMPLVPGHLLGSCQLGPGQAANNGLASLESFESVTAPKYLPATSPGCYFRTC